MPRIVSLNVSNGGVPKLPVPRARLGRLGLEGDRQAHVKFHGGPERAVCLYSIELVRVLCEEGHRVVPGALGENVTLEGIDLGALTAGARLRLGSEAVVELASHAVPCKQIASCFAGGAIARIAPGTGAARFYARVLVEGDLATGDPVELLAT